MNATKKALANLVLAAAATLALNVAKSPVRFEGRNTRAAVTAAAR